MNIKTKHLSAMSKNVLNVDVYVHHYVNAVIGTPVLFKPIWKKMYKMY